MSRSANARVLVFLVFCYCVYFGFISFLKYRSYAYNDFDLAVHALSVRSLCHGSWYNSILGIPFLGNHMQPILFLCVPFYMVFQHPGTLLALQTLALGCAAFPLYTLARRVLDERWALVIGIAYLLYPAVGYVNLYEFHPGVFAVFFVFMALRYYQDGSFGKYLAYMFLAMACQENVPFIFIVLGVCAWFEKKDKRWGIVTVAASVAYAAFAFLIMRALNKDTVQYLLLYEHLGSSVSEIARTLITHPSHILRAAARVEVFNYCLNLLAPLAFIPALAWTRLVPAGPFLFQHILSNRPTELLITYHYTVESIPFIFWALAYGIKRILSVSRDRRFPALLQGLVVAAAVIGNAAAGPQLRLTPFFLTHYAADAQDRFKEQCVRSIGPRESVVATFEFLARLCDRPRLYSFHHQCKGTYTLSRKPYQLPEDVNYALIDFNDYLTFNGFCRGNAYLNTRGFLLNRPWALVDFRDSVVLLKRGVQEQFPLTGVIEEGQDIVVADNAGVVVDGSLRLLGAEFPDTSCAQENIDLTLYWQCHRPTVRDIEIVFHVVDTEGRIHLEKRIPLCYRLFPSYSWRQGERYRQQIRLHLGEQYLTAPYALHISLIDACSGEYLVLEGSQNDKSFCLKRELLCER